MKLTPNCKINLGLRVIRRREDGYHDIETVFYPVFGLHDELEIEASDAFSFQEEGLVVDCPPESNLIVRCYRLMAELFPGVGPVNIRFRKRIPFGAGLGGGSSDAAHTAIALNEIFGLGLSEPELARIVSRLGADCAFFVYNTPCFATGIGDRLKPIDISLKGRRLVMIKPDVYVSTREAYSGIVPREAAGQESVWPEDFCDVTNDFEQTVFALHPELAQIKQHLIDCGAVCAAMSGSGSTVFGLFERDAEGRTDADLRALHEEFASMVIFDDTL